MLVLEAALEQEQAMHGVTKAQLAALRDDNQRLRHQLHAIRRHAVVNAEPATSVCAAASSSFCALLTLLCGRLGDTPMKHKRWLTVAKRDGRKEVISGSTLRGGQHFTAVLVGCFMSRYRQFSSCVRK